jgi:organic hydroperoxide reductase OsmC/OhrA
MEISARVVNELDRHEATVRTGASLQSLQIPARAAAGGSAVNGGELLMLALATCYCNDLYREARRLGIVLQKVEVEASAEFGAVGMAASNVRYRARVVSPADPHAIDQLLRETDAVAEVHNTLRKAVPVELILA